MSENIVEALNKLAKKLGVEEPTTENITEAIDIITANLDGNGGSGGGSSSDWPLSDRMAKGTKSGAIVEGEISGDYANVASGESSHAEGSGITASGNYSHGEGGGTTASGVGSHSEGTTTTASGASSHAEGTRTKASGNYSHAEGGDTTASGDTSHAEGSATTASGASSHAEGSSTVANHYAQHVFGTCNTPDSSNAAATVRGTYVEIVGNGTSNNARSNARTLDWDGNEKLAGSLTLGMGTVNEVTITAAQLAELLTLLN